MIIGAFMGLCHNIALAAKPYPRRVLILSSRRWYDPLKKETNLNAPALKKWLANGAQPSDTVKSLLQKAFVIEPEPIKVVVPKNAVPKL